MSSEKRTQNKVEHLFVNHPQILRMKNDAMEKYFCNRITEQNVWTGCKIDIKSEQLHDTWNVHITYNIWPKKVIVGGIRLGPVCRLIC